MTTQRTTTQRPSARSTEVLVIGGGHAGTRAARVLADAGREVLLVEGSDRLGGRTMTARSGAAPVDLGGQWIGPGQDRVLALAGRYGLATFPTHTAGTDLLVDPRRGARPLGLPALLPHLLGAAASAPGVLRLLRWSRRSGTDGALRARLSAVPAAEWLRDHLRTDALREAVALAVRTEYCREPEEISLLPLVLGLAEGDAPLDALRTDGGAQQDLFVDGADRLPHLLAADLPVRTGTRATSLRGGAQGMRVELSTSAGIEEVLADRVVVAVPPHQVRALLGRRASGLAPLSMGRVVKMIAVYDEPFWRGDGRSGFLAFPDGPVSVAMDVSPPGGPAHLCLLAGGRDADRLGRLAAPERRERVLSVLAGVLGPRARAVSAWHEKVWAQDPWAGGGYGTTAAPGPQPRWPHLDGVSFAGTETAAEWSGFIDGALRSGERAAEETLTALG